MSVDEPRVDGATSSRFESQTVSLVRRNPWWLALGASPWILGVVFALAGAVTGQVAFLTPLFHLAVFGALGIFYAFKRNKSPRFESGTLTSDLEGVRLHGQLVVRRDELKQGFVIPREGRFFVRLVKKGLAPSVQLDVKDVAEGRAILRSLGLDASQTVAEISGLSQVFTWSSLKQMLLFMSPVLLTFVGVFGGILAAGPKGAASGVIGMIASMALLMAFVAARTKIQVGADGILTRWLGKERYFPFSQIELVNPYEGRQLNKTYLGVELLLRSGEIVRLLVGQKRWAEEEAGLLVERIREAVDAYTSGMAGDDASILGRNGRAPKDWVTSLRALGAGANADMRTSPIPLERLWRIVEDASASAVARASAAIALAPQVPPAERRRIHVAAESTASPKLRVALEAATNRELSDESLAQALSELESEAEGPTNHKPLTLD